MFSLFEILSNTCIGIAFFLSYDVMNFEVNIFLITPFTTWPKSQDKKLNILRTKRTFQMKQKAFSIVFKGLSVFSCLKSENLPLPFCFKASNLIYRFIIHVVKIYNSWNNLRFFQIRIHFRVFQTVIKFYTISDVRTLAYFFVLLPNVILLNIQRHLTMD